MREQQLHQDGDLGGSASAGPSMGIDREVGNVDVGVRAICYLSSSHRLNVTFTDAHTGGWQYPWSSR